MGNIPVYQAQPHMTPLETWTLTLNRYQRDNLLQLIQRIMEGSELPLSCWHTGDWVGEIRWMLGKKYHSGFGKGIEQIFVIDEDDNPLPRIS